jgi:hypothetical protein
MALAKRSIAIPVIDALAKPLHCSLTIEARQGLRDCGEGEVTEILQLPEAFARVFDPSTNYSSNAA